MSEIYQNNSKKILAVILFLSFSFIVLFMREVFSPIQNFPTEKLFVVERGEPGEQIFKRLKSEGYIRSVWSARFVAKFFGYTRFYPGEYKFETPLSVFQMVYSVTKRPISYAVLIPPGYTKIQVADRLATYIRKFDKKDFLMKAKEGYLYPDTYYFFSMSTTDEILKDFENKFYKETFGKFGRVPTNDEVIIASMLEREARKPEDMRVVSGIIKNRLEANMLLQIDATVLYGRGAWKSRTMYSDLKHQSDYNTYLNKGLPIGPISNPGFDSLYAAMNPTESNYVYYLTGKDGKFYYAKTHEEHVRNKFKYLK